MTKQQKSKSKQKKVTGAKGASVKTQKKIM